MDHIRIASLISGLALTRMAYTDDAHHPKEGGVADAAQPTGERMQENVKRITLHT